jgi:hypothetical protein
MSVCPEGNRVVGYVGATTVIVADPAAVFHPTALFFRWIGEPAA